MLVTCARHRTPGAAHLSKGVERRGFHLDGEDALCARRLNGLRCLAKGCVRRPARADNRAQRDACKRVGGRGDECRVGLGKLRWRRIMVAGALVTKRPVDHDEVGRGTGGRDLPGRCEAHQEAAAAGEEFFGDERRERRADHAPDDTDRLTRERERVEFGVIAGPFGETLRLAALAQPAHDVAIGVEQAHRRDLPVGDALLPPRLAQERGRLEHRRGGRVLVVEDRRRAGVSCGCLRMWSPRRSDQVC